MRRSHGFRLSTRAGRLIGTSALVAGMMSALVLAVAAPAAHAASAYATIRVPPSRLDRVPMLQARARSNDNTRLSQAQAAIRAAKNGWKQAKEINEPTGCASNECLFGWAVATSGDTMVVSAPNDNGGIGEVFVYTGSGKRWTQEGVLTPADSPAGDFFGGSLAISSGTIVVGAYGYDNYVGNAYVYSYSGSGNSFTATQQAELYDPGLVSFDEFGGAVAVSGDSIVVSASGENSNEGAVYSYDNDGGSWPLEDTLLDPGGVPNDSFGYDVAFQSSTLVVGAPGTAGTGAESPGNSDEPFTGAAYVFQEVEGGWTQSAELTASNGQGCVNTCSEGYGYITGDWFGYSVALNGTTVAIGAPFASYPVPEPDGAGNGTAYAFKEVGGSWTQKQELYDPAESTSGPPYNGDWFGYNVAFLGKSIVANAPGAPQGFESNDATGASFVFSGHKGTWATYPVELTALDGYPGEYFGYGVATIGKSYVLVGAPYWASASSYGSGSLYIFKD